MQTFESIWDALEDNPVKAKKLKLRSELMIAINQAIDGMTQVDAAQALEITQPRVSALKKGEIESFRLDALVDMAHRLGLSVSVAVAA